MGHDHPSLNPRYDQPPGGGCLIALVLLPLTLCRTLAHYLRR